MEKVPDSSPKSCRVEMGCVARLLQDCQGNPSGNAWHNTGRDTWEVRTYCIRVIASVMFLSMYREPIIFAEKVLYKINYTKLEGTGLLLLLSLLNC